MDSLPFDPNDIEALRRRIAELETNQHSTVGNSDSGTLGGRVARVEHKAEADHDRSGTVIETQGGAFTQGSIEAGGHFIGRDFIQLTTQIVYDGEDPDEARSVIALYLYALVADISGMKLGEIDIDVTQMQREPLQLVDVYVPLNTQLRIPEGMQLIDWLSQRQDPAASDRAPQQNTRSVTALEALGAHRELTILGAPGSGKSTFGASVLLALAQLWQGQRDGLATLGDKWALDSLLPVRVVLRRFADQLPDGTESARAGDLWAFIGRDLEASGYGLSAETSKYVQRLARSHGAFILLDGLDECGNAALRRRVLAAVQELMRSAGPKCRFLITARPYAWPGGSAPARGVYVLADLSDEQIERFIQSWYAALMKRAWLVPGDAERKSNDLLAATARPDLMPLSRSPLLLTLMATMHANRGRLPDDRADLYDETVDLLMLRWNRQIGADKALLDELSVPGLKLSDIRAVLEELAFGVHETTSEGADGFRAVAIELTSTTEIGEDRLIRAFRPLLNNSWDKAALVVEYMEKRAGLLLSQGEKQGERQFAFPHRTIQEFLAARHLASRVDFPAQCVRLARDAPGHWKLVLLLAARLAHAERGASAADELIGGNSIAEFRARRQPETIDWTCALLAGMQLQEIGVNAVNRSDRTRAIAARVTSWLVASLPVHPDDGGAFANQRAQAGEVLAALGDPRFDPTLFQLPADDLLGFVKIAADSGFRIGTQTSDLRRVASIVDRMVVPNEEINDTVTPTPDFFLARYLVTVAQFKAFVESTGFVIDTAAVLREPDSRPVRSVSWCDAVAYCDWLQEILATSAAFHQNELAALIREGRWRVTLPSELEWEKAARGGLNGAVFSWGNEPDPDRANYVDSEIGDSSPVGCFPANGFGIHDMIGNVWEWTRSPYVTYPCWTDDGRENREVVVRGGRFLSDQWRARCAYRYSLPPDERDMRVGFRVALRYYPP